MDKRNALCTSLCKQRVNITKLATGHAPFFVRHHVLPNRCTREGAFCYSRSPESIRSIEFCLSSALGYHFGDY